MAAAVMLILATALVGRVWITRDGTVGGLGDDPGLFSWYLRWTPWALAHGQNPLITHHILAPDGANLLWNTSIVLPSVLLWPVTVVAGPLWSYNVLITLGPALSGLVAWLALRRHASSPAAFAGGVLYGFSPAMAGQSLGHPMITVAVFAPLALILMEDILVAPRRRTRLIRGALLGAAAAAQLLTGTEMLALTVLGAGTGLGVLAALQPHQVRARARPVLEGLGAAAATGLILGALPLAVLLVGPYHVSGSLQTPDVYVQDLAGLVLPGPFQALAPDAAVARTATFTGNAVEVSGYVGIPLLVTALVVAAALWSRGRAPLLVRWASLTTLLLVLLALGPHLHVNGRVTSIPMPWRLLGGRPLLTSLLPARFMVLAFLPLAVLVAAGIDAVLYTHRAAARIGALAAALLVALTLLPRPLPVSTPQVPAFFTGGEVAARIPDGTTVLLSPQSTGYSAMVDQAAADMRFRMIAGGVFVEGPRFGPPPGPLDDAVAAAEGTRAWTIPDLEAQAAIRADLEGRHLAAVVVAPQLQRDRVVALFTALLARPPDEVRGVLLWMLPSGRG